MELSGKKRTSKLEDISNASDANKINLIPSRSSKDFVVLRCQEKQMVKMADLIKTALNEVGCEELPSGCDDISVEPGFIENSISTSEQPVS